MKKIQLLSVLVLLSLISACDEQPIVIPKFVPPTSDRVILVEELTGVNCANCPSASKTLESYIDTFQGQVIGVGVHGEFLSEPITGSTYDFRNDYARDLERSFTFFGKPAAVINRGLNDNGDLFAEGPDSWLGKILDELAKPNIMNISLETTYDPDTRELSVTAFIRALTDISEELFISVLLTESGIVDAQKDVDEIIQDYTHNHVLRTMLTEDFNGKSIGNGMSENQVITQEFSYILPDEDGTWIAENIDVVVHVRSDEAIIQAAECHGCLD